MPPGSPHPNIHLALVGRDYPATRHRLPVYQRAGICPAGNQKPANVFGVNGAQTQGEHLSGRPPTGRDAPTDRSGRRKTFGGGGADTQPRRTAGPFWNTPGRRLAAVHANGLPTTPQPLPPRLTAEGGGSQRSCLRGNRSEFASPHRWHRQDKAVMSRFNWGGGVRCANCVRLHSLSHVEASVRFWQR